MPHIGTLLCTGEEEEEEEEEVCNTSNNATIDEFTTSPPTILCKDNPNDIIEKVSPNISTANVNIIDDESYTEQSNKYYDNIDNEILQTDYEGTIVFEDCEDAEEPTTKNVTTTNSNNNINMAPIKLVKVPAKPRLVCICVEACRNLDLVSKPNEL